MTGKSIIAKERKMENIEKVETVDTSDLEARLKALENENAKLKVSISKTNSENAEWKKKYQSTLSEQEQARIKAEEEAQARAEKEAEKDRIIEEYKRDKNISQYQTKFLESGYSPEMALSSAQAMADGNNEVLFTNLKTFVETKTKEIEAKALNQQPNLSVGETPTSQSVEEERQAKLRRYAGL